ncbi:hypothetical protein TSOC_004807 [Tetrabaena socialis]|uniref:Uncharacterized protein n=1 Tax=Tetrabaena socialis TaxID=47790 RepID=A0A2J8A7X3_9CHLO|nr:hypothetical protein TSOC_004807 [Tetrabaena socialis]|eukprot:PNH08618.1 hypothetical protein TSOC_004807 [Tetrabaena socialis]
MIPFPLCCADLDAPAAPFPWRRSAARAPGCGAAPRACLAPALSAAPSELGGRPTTDYQAANYPPSAFLAGYGCQPFHTDADSDADKADAHLQPTSPSCALAAAAHATATTSAGSSGEHSGASAAPTSAAVLNSIAVLAREPPLRYRRSPCSSATLAAAALLRGPRRAMQLHIKLPQVDPADLQPGFVGAIDAALRSHGSPLVLAGANVRRGCVQLTLDLLEAYGGGGFGCTAAGGGTAMCLELDLPALVLSALGVPPPYGGGRGGDGDGDGGDDDGAVGQSAMRRTAAGAAAAAAGCR